jgi:hypothetical protein
MLRAFRRVTIDTNDEDEDEDVERRDVERRGMLTHARIVCMSCRVRAGV